MLIRLIKLAACGVVFGGFIGSSLLVRVVLVWASSATRRRAGIYLMQICARQLLRILYLKIHLPVPAQLSIKPGCLLVSNHQSYLDILVLAAYFPVQFVAKQEVADWPLIGWMARLGNTIFINRGSTRHSLKCSHEIACLLQQGISVLVFPEGTSTNGAAVLPFKPLLFGAAVKAEAPVMPVTLNYLTINEQPLDNKTRDLCCWYGAMEFVSHFWNVLSLSSIEVLLEPHEILNPRHASSSQELAQRAWEKVAHQLAASSATTSATTETLGNCWKVRAYPVVGQVINLPKGEPEKAWQVDNLPHIEPEKAWQVDNLPKGEPEKAWQVDNLPHIEPNFSPLT